MKHRSRTLRWPLDGSRDIRPRSRRRRPPGEAAISRAAVVRTGRRQQRFLQLEARVTRTHHDGPYLGQHHGQGGDRRGGPLVQRGGNRGAAPAVCSDSQPEESREVSCNEHEWRDPVTGWWQGCPAAWEYGAMTRARSTRGYEEAPLDPGGGQARGEAGISSPDSPSRKMLRPQTPLRLHQIVCSPRLPLF